MKTFLAISLVALSIGCAREPSETPAKEVEKSAAPAPKITPDAGQFAGRWKYVPSEKDLDEARSHGHEPLTIEIEISEQGRFTMTMTSHGKANVAEGEVVAAGTVLALHPRVFDGQPAPADAQSSPSTFRLNPDGHIVADAGGATFERVR